jgi:hypothetical protein
MATNPFGPNAGWNLGTPVDIMNQDNNVGFNVPPPDNKTSDKDISDWTHYYDGTSLYRKNAAGVAEQIIKYDPTKGKPDESMWMPMETGAEYLGTKDFKEYSFPTITKTVTKDNTTEPIISNDIATEIYNRGMANIKGTKNFVIGNAIGQSALNLANLSNAFGKMPNPINIAPIGYSEMPSERGIDLAELHNAEGTYESNIRREGMEKGWSPKVLIGAHANVLAQDRAGLGEIAKLETEQTNEEIAMNKKIEEKNVSQEYSSAIENARRNDDIEKNRSVLFSQGLSQAGAIGTNLGQELLKVNNMGTQEEVAKYAIAQMQKAQSMKEYLFYYNLAMGNTNAATQYAYTTARDDKGNTTNEQKVI